MRDLQFKKIISLNPILYWLTIVLGASIVFLVDALLYVKSGDEALINAKHFFGLFGNNFTAISIAILIIIIYTLCSYKNKFLFPMWFVLVGATSNLVGRVYLGGVVDYINKGFIPTFNIADILIIFGLFLSVITQTKKLKKFS